MLLKVKQEAIGLDLLEFFNYNKKGGVKAPI